MLLPKTLQSLQDTQKEVVKDTLQDTLYRYGVNVSVLDMVFGHYFIYALLSDGVLAPVFLHQNRISYKQSQTYGLPKLHFCLCSTIKDEFSFANKSHTLAKGYYVAKVAKENSFSVSIRQGISEVGLYNNYPLELCTSCSDILQQIREGEVIDSTLGVYLFSYQWLKLLESNPSIRQKELIALQSASLHCYKCKEPITLETSVWISVQERILKVCCC